MNRNDVVEMLSRVETPSVVETFFRLGNASRQESALAHDIDLAYKYHGVAVNQDHHRPKSLHHSSHKTSCHTSHRYPAANC